MTREAVIVSVARTPIGRAYRGAFNATKAPTLAAHAIRAAVERAGVDPAEIDDCLIGSALPQGEQHTIGRTAALRAGLPVTVAGMTLDRQCSSGLMTIATAAKQVIVDRMEVVVAGGVESISLVQTPEVRLGADPELVAMHKDVYMPMLQTAEVVAHRYGVSRERQDAYSLLSQQRTAAGQAAGRFDAEIVPVTTTMKATDKATGQVSDKTITLTKDEGNRPETTLEGLAALKPVVEGGSITAGNASQMTDGAAALLVVNEKALKAHGLTPLARVHTMSVTAGDPVIMLEEPAPATRKALARAGMKLDDIDLFEVNEAFAAVVLSWLKNTGADPARLNVNGGAIALGHPLDASGAKLMTQLVHALGAQNKRWGLQVMCEGGGVANATIIERL